MAFFTGSETRSGVIDPRNPKDPALKELFGLGAQAATGVSVTEDSAMRLSAVFACVRLISNNMAQLPLHFYQHADSRGDLAKEHPLYRITHRKPNPYMTSYQWRSMMQSNVLLSGNAYSEIERDMAGRVKALWPWPSNQVRPVQDGWNITYEFSTKGGLRTLPREQVFHLRGLSRNGLIGISNIAAAREAIGLGLAIDQFAGKFFSNGSATHNILSLQDTVSAEKKKEIQAAFEQWHRGIENAHRLAVVDLGAKLESVGLSNEDAQLLETRKFSRAEIASIFGVQPHLIGEMDSATFSNIEQQSLEHVQYTLSPWMENWEQQLAADLLSDDEIDFYWKHNPRALLRGDARTQMWALGQGINWGIYSPNDARDLLDMNPRQDGDDYLQPSNLIVSGAEAWPTNDGTMET